MTTQIKGKYELISSDDHFVEPPGTWQDRVPERFKVDAPRVERTPQGDVWIAEGKRRGGVGLSALAGRKYEDYKSGGMTYDDVRPGFYDPKHRLRDMDQDGVWASVIYPSVGMGIFTMQDPELHLACVRAYNDFTAEFNESSPDRLFGLGVLPRNSIDVALAELERMAKMGIKGAYLQKYPSGGKYPSASDERFWAAAQEMGLPLHIHIRLAGRFEDFAVSPEDPHPPMNSNLPMMMSGFALMAHGCQEAFAQLIFSGVMARYPDLKWVSVESGIGWIPYFLDRWDNNFERQRHWAQLAFDMKPSEYWRRQVYATFEEDKVGVLLAHMLPDICPVDNLMWACDYPHSDTTWPHSREIVREQFKDIPDEDRRKVVWENCQKLYGIPAPRT